MTEALVFITGLVMGSFLNVCIYRMPRNESIITPRSHCVSCGKTIPWYDNIPLLSILALRGRCRFCKKRISFLYFTVELLTGLMFLALFEHFGVSARFFIFAAVSAALIVVSFIDLKTQEIPDEITLPGIGIGVILSFIFPGIMSQAARFPALLYSALGAVVGGGITYMMGVFGKALFKKDAMGGGDVKLMAMLGAVLGWKLIVVTFFLAPLFGSVAGIYVLVKKKETIMPYGPHLSLAAVTVIFWGERILEWLLIL